jgi:AAHS family 4-hydroxybenzoate transporter-like MFS transporter
MILGATVSSAFIAPLGDVHGRKKIILFGLIFMGICVCATATSATIMQLQVWRFLSGLGFGAATVNVAALITEQLPAQRRNLLLTVASAAFSLGAGVGGFTAPVLLDAFGWPGIFVAGGVPAIVLAVTLLLTVPESLPDGARRATMPAAPHADLAKPARHSPLNGVRGLLARRWIAVTVTLWTLCVLNNVMLFLIVGWLPSLLTGTGWAIGSASRAAAMVQIGGIAGGLLLTWLFDRSTTSAPLVVAYAVLAPLLLLFGIVPSQVFIWSALLALLGAGIIGSYYALSAIAATIYPSEVRATAIGWAGAWSRIGSISGSLIGGLLLFLGLSTVHMLALLSLPALVCLLLAAYLLRVRRLATV